MSFFSLLESRVQAANTLLCVGLDPHKAELISGKYCSETATDEEVSEAAYTFCKNLILQTSEFSACYKPNAAFFESLGASGHETLKKVIGLVPSEIPVLLDCKRGDIGSTAEAYAIASYEKLDAHGVTLSPLMGYDSIEPFVSKQFQLTGGAFLLCKTSNPGSEDILNKDMKGGKKLYENIAELATSWSIKSRGESENKTHNLGLVVGATDVIALKNARASAGELWILAPGIGAQGGDLEGCCLNGMDSEGGKLLIPVGDKKQIMTLFIRKSENEFDKEELGDFAFVPMLEKKN